MSDLMTDSQQQTNSRVFKSPLVSFSTVTGSGRFVSGMKQFRDANPDLCNEVTEQKAWAISPTVVQITEGFNSREMGMGEAYYQLPEVADHLNNIKNAYIRGDYVDPIRVLIKDGIPYVRQGHCRLKAALMAVAEGHSNLTILCIEMKADEIQRLTETVAWLFLLWLWVNPTDVFRRWVDGRLTVLPNVREKVIPQLLLLFV